MDDGWSTSLAVVNAVLEEDLAQVAAMLEAGADVHDALGMALFCEDFQIAKFLIEQGADLNELTHTAANVSRERYNNCATYLIGAAAQGHTEVVSFLLENRADPDLPSILSGQTALFSAARNGHVEITRLLLKYGADVEVEECFEGSTAIDDAIQFGHAETVRLLLAHGARGSFRSATFLGAARESSADICEMLLEAGADVNLRGKWGRTPLMWAAANAPVETIQLLLDHGADINLVSGPYGVTCRDDRETALGIASEAGRAEVVALLEKRGAHEAAPHWRFRQPFRVAIGNFLRS